MTPTDVKQTRRSNSALTRGTWVLVADGEKALLMENVGDAGIPLLEVRRERHGDNPPTHAQGADRPGRRSDGPGAQRSAMEETDWHRLEKERFAAGLAEMLYRLAHAGRFERLILVAPPRILGSLRKETHKEVAARIVAEVALDLTHHPVDEIAARVAAATTPEGPPD
ncbi:Host attachment protein [Rhodobacterales bacterium HKCCSP123]|nr:Host attachment protein [Rhodobacterales bacterium HKCCSP123]